jgi:hypothetical protein
VKRAYTLQDLRDAFPQPTMAVGMERGIAALRRLDPAAAFWLLEPDGGLYDREHPPELPPR